MAPTIVHLPNGHNISVTPVFGGLFFKPNELNTHHAAFPPGWTIQIHTEDSDADHIRLGTRDHTPQGTAEAETPHANERHVHRFKTPTLQSDSIYISSLSNPSSNEFKSATSPTRQIAMMLWATLYWYFQQPEPDSRLTNEASSKTPDKGKPKGDWRVRIKREGIFRGKNLMQKLERMGLIICEDSSVGTALDDKAGDGWQNMFISRRAYWQLDGRIFLFTLSPIAASPYATGSPYPSRPSSPNEGSPHRPAETQGEVAALATSQGLWAPSSPGPFASASHLPTYFPPPPLQYILTGGVRHPIRPKPPRQGETFYTRFIPSLGQYLSFRVASLSAKPPIHLGPTTLPTHLTSSRPTSMISDLSLAPISNPHVAMNDVEYLHRWMNDPRVADFWGEEGPTSHQESFLKAGLNSRHSFPVIGCWDGKPFGYFEIYWVKEDPLGRYLETGGEPWDRGFHALVGEQEFRGSHRVSVWMSSLVHFCFLADNRTQNVYLEPRADNSKFISYLEGVGFSKEREVALPHKQAALMRIRREAWESPAL